MRSLRELGRTFAARVIFGVVLYAPGAFAAPPFPSELPKGVKPWEREPAVDAAFQKGKLGNIDGAVAALRPLAAAGNVQAIGQLANYQATGRGMPRDEKAGCAAAREAYNRGAVNAASGFIGCLINGSMDGPKDGQWQQALRVASDAWEKHRYVQALGYIGLMQEEGIGMKASPAGAERTYTLAMRYGDETSAWFLAQLWESGKVGKRSPPLVTKLYRHAALRMYGPSMIEMAKRLSQQSETLQEALAWASLAEARHEDEAPALMRDIRSKLERTGMKPDRKALDTIVGEMAIVAMEPAKLP